MNIEMKMPDMSTADAVIKVVNWLVAPGQSVERGQPVLEIETDKATMEVEAFARGTLKEIVAQPEAEVEVGQVIAIIEVEGTAAAATSDGPSQPAAEPPAAKPAAPSPAPASGGMFARNRQKAAKSVGAPGAKPPLALSLAQRTVARRMQESKQTIPHFYLQSSANAEPMRARRNAAAGQKPVWDAFIAHAAGKALKQFSRLCAAFRDGALIPQEVDAVGIAVDLDGDLYVVQITTPAAKTPEQISDEIRALVQRLRDGDPEVRRVRPSNLTISNLGATGVEAFVPIVNPPEAAVLGIGTVSPAVVALDGQVAIQHRVALTLAVDHRVVNGRYAADFLQSVVRELEAVA